MSFADYFMPIGQAIITAAGCDFESPEHTCNCKGDDLVREKDSKISVEHYNERDKCPINARAELAR